MIYISDLYIYISDLCIVNIGTFNTDTDDFMYELGKSIYC